MPRFIHFLVLVALLSAGACQPDQSESAALKINDIPLLLDRHPAIQQGKEWEQIQSAYGQARQQAVADPKNLEARLNLAYVFINEARITGEHGHYYPGALKMLNSILAQKELEQDLRFRALAAQAGVQLSLHDFKTALATAQAAVALNPYNAQIYGALVDAHVELGQYPEAVAMADKMVSIRPDLRSYSRVSYLREIHGDVAGAIAAMQLAVDAGVPGQESTCWARLTLGNLHREYGEADQAVAEYQRILAERPDYPFALAALAEVKMAEKAWAEAEKLLNQAAGIIPEVGFFEQLATIQKQRGQTAAYQETLETILAMYADDEKNGHNMDLEYARLYDELVGDYAKAWHYAQKEWKKRPENIDVNRRMALVCMKRGEKAAAEKYLAKAQRTQSKHPELAAIQAELALR